MIGQKYVLNQIDKFVGTSGNRFIIIIGRAGSGKKQMANYIAKKLNANLIVNDNKIDTVRECIKTSYTQTEKIIYAFYDADKMSNGAKNSLLKITEEPPKKAYFILTVADRWTLPKTLISRASVFHMQWYSSDNLIEYAKTVKDFDDEELGLIATLCDVPGQVNLLAETDVKLFNEFVNLVVDNIAEVSGANAFKISQKLKLKEDGEGFDVRFFLQTVAKLFIKKIGKKDYVAWRLTAKAINELNVTGINKQFLIDRWILDIRDNFLED
jgi:replication-associated recombination protein RarA